MPPARRDKERIMNTQIVEATDSSKAAGVPARTTGRRRSALIGAFSGLMAGLVMMCTAGSANAATLTPGTFNASLSSSWNWGDCFIEVGPVVDYYSPWAAIGGALAQCSGRHASTTIAVGLRFNGALVSGSVRNYYYYNSYGTGSRI